MDFFKKASQEKKIKTIIKPALESLNELKKNNKIGIVAVRIVGLSLTAVIASKGYNTVGIDVDKKKCKKK